MNYIQIEGRLTQDVVIKHDSKPDPETGEMKPYTLMTGAVAYNTDQPSGKDKDGKNIFVNFVNFQSWSPKLIELYGPSLKKGQSVVLEGVPVQNTFGEGDDKTTRLRISLERIHLTTIPKKADAAAEGAAQA